MNYVWVIGPGESVSVTCVEVQSKDMCRYIMLI